MRVRGVSPRRWLIAPCFFGSELTARPVRLALLALAASLFWFQVNVADVRACKCAVPGLPAEELEKSEAVFAGTVVSIRHSFDPDVTPYKPGDHTTVGFDVSTVWKGAVHERTYVTTPPTGGSCGFRFSEGERYIVYAHISPADSSSFSATICSRTAPLAEAQADLQALAEGRAPLPGTTGPPAEQASVTTATSPWFALLAVAGAVLILGGILAYARRR